MAQRLARLLSPQEGYYLGRETVAAIEGFPLTGDDEQVRLFRAHSGGWCIAAIPVIQAGSVYELKQTLKDTKAGPGTTVCGGD